MTSDAGQMATPEDRPVDRVSDESLWNEVRDLYLRDTPTRPAALEVELASVRAALGTLRAATQGRYWVTDLLGVGGTGVVFKVWDTRLHTYRAMKVARPIEGKEVLVAALLSEEISRLQEMSHPNVISIFDAGELDSPSGKLPFFAMTFIRGAAPAQKYFGQKRTLGELQEFVVGTLAGIAHLHQKNLLHLDLKPSNIFVSSEGRAIVADLGGARSLQGDPNEALVVTCTTRYAHPELIIRTDISAIGGDNNRRRGQLARKDLRAQFDLFALGKTVFEVLHTYEKANPGFLTGYARKYLMLMGARLLDGQPDDSERPLGLTKSTLESLKYGAAADALTDALKLVGKVNLLAEIPELSPTSERVIQATPGRKTILTERVAALLREPLLRRLATISQLGVARLVYPTATHTRLEHSLGTYSNATEYIAALYNDPINPLFRQIVRPDDLLATLLAALLHDVGQYQYAHDLLNVEPAVFRHETLTAELLLGRDTFFSNLTEPLRKAIAGWGVSAERVLAILAADPDRLSSDLRDRLLHTLISGPLDADKLDYLVRDSLQCQTVFGAGIDRARLLGTLTVVYTRQGKGENQYFALGIHEKGRPAAESVAFTRYQMYRAVYWHHAVRAAKSMLQRAAYEWLASRAGGKKNNDAFKSDLYHFVLQRRREKRDKDQQSVLFDDAAAASSNRVGEAIRPRWSLLNPADLEFLDWLHPRTTDTGRRLLEMLAVRQLFKRITVVSKSQDPTLWWKIQGEIVDHRRLKDQSERLRAALETRVQRVLGGNAPRYTITDIGDATDAIAAGVKALQVPGNVLIDVPKPRGHEVLRFYPEELHRGQREEFEESPSLGISEVWTLLFDNLHEIAGSVRVFVHPLIDDLRRARPEGGGQALLGPDSVAEELHSLFGVVS